MSTSHSQAGKRQEGHSKRLQIKTELQRVQARGSVDEVDESHVDDEASVDLQRIG